MGGILLFSPASSLAEPTNLNPEQLDNPFTAKANGYCYLINGRTSTPASLAQWGEAEEARGYVNTPWAQDGTSSILAGQYSDYAFLANPSYWRGRSNIPSDADYNLAEPPYSNSDNGLLYYKGSSQLYSPMEGETQMLNLKSIFTWAKPMIFVTATYRVAAMI